jgi:hypothetical protein
VVRAECFRECIEAGVHGLAVLPELRSESGHGPQLANGDMMKQAPMSARTPYRGRARGLPAASRSAIRAAISGESRRAATSATPVCRATFPDATGVTGP